MTVSDPGRRRVGLIVCLVLAAALQGCGGGGNGDGGGNGNPTATAQVTNPGQVNTATPTRPPGAPTLTPTRTGGTTGTRTPTPTATRTVPPGSTATATPTVEGSFDIVVPPGGNLRNYVRRAPANSTLILSPGAYAPMRLEAGDVQGPITLYADVEGAFSEVAPAEVVINGGTQAVAVELREVADITLDGLTMVGGTSAALLIVDSPGVIIADCTIRKSKGHAVVFERSDDGLFFNNLVHDNAGTGLRVLGSDLLFAINNTIYGSRAHGVFIGKSNGQASTNLLLENSIVNRNQPSGITIDTVAPSSLTGYFGDFNLNSDGYGSGTPPGDNDINGSGSLSDPQFFLPSAGDFRLSATSPALDAGDFETDPGLVPFLTERTTQRDQSLDTEPVDLGYHYLVVPTPTPRP
ncbi:right-handed parallel beta-helix repeat-containing protein [Candidatus Binatia bacterium]|nr:right-handed parallel beta-helix repeat-containing protein [Candidatus Binatia bacterium]